MPYIIMQDASGRAYHISTGSEQLLQAWLDEWLPRLWPPGLPEKYGNPLIQVWPVYLGESLADPDWVTDSRVLGRAFLIPRDPAQVLAALVAKRAELEQQIAGLPSMPSATRTPR